LPRNGGRRSGINSNQPFFPGPMLHVFPILSSYPHQTQNRPLLTLLFHFHHLRSALCCGCERDEWPIVHGADFSVDFDSRVLKKKKKEIRRYRAAPFLRDLEVIVNSETDLGGKAPRHHPGNGEPGRQRALQDRLGEEEVLLSQASRQPQYQGNGASCRHEFDVLKSPCFCTGIHSPIKLCPVICYSSPGLPLCLLFNLH
jgi:hypothetical protein